MSANPVILGIGSAVPTGRLNQDEAADIACRLIEVKGRSRAVRALYARSGVETRSSVLVEPGRMAAGRCGDGVVREPVLPMYEREGIVAGTAERMRAYREHASPLAQRACESALRDAGVAAESITHVVTVSCTGFDSPGVDLKLIGLLGLRADVKRLNVGFMGCHAAVNAMGVARDICRSEPSSRVLVCCIELCTLHFQRASGDGTATANALFADGAAALVVGVDADADGGVGGSGVGEIVSTASVVIPETAGMMSWSITDHGFVMTLGKDVPSVLAEFVPGWVAGWLGRHGLGVGDVARWVVHPGGPRVLDAVGEVLGVAERDMEISRAVLREQGNMSSGTVLMIYERIMRERMAGGGVNGPVVMLAFGPGLAGEGVLVG